MRSGNVSAKALRAAVILAWPIHEPSSPASFCDVFQLVGWTRGFVGGFPYANRTGGLTSGVQTETWW
jgi:hypothetical protein